MNIGFIGLGKLGEPCAFKMAENGMHDVIGYDINPDIESRVPVKDTIADAILDRDIVFIAVPTPHDPNYDGKEPTIHLEPKDFDYSYIRSVLDEIEKTIAQKTIVVLISTVLPGTVSSEFADFKSKFRFVYNPYLIAMGTVEFDMVNPEMVIMGSDDKSAIDVLTDFYKTIMQNRPRYIAGTIEEAESIKIFYNTWISTKLALVNMMQDVAEKIGNIDIDVVTGALAESTYRITGPKYMTAGLGDGGACHPRDNIALRSLAERLDLGYDLFHSIMEAREQQARNMAQLLVSYNLPVVIVGKSYKPGVTYSAGSVSILTGEYVKQLGGKVHYIDYDNCDDTRDSEPHDSTAPAVYLLAHSSDVTYDKSNSERAYSFVPAPGSVIVDPWRRNLSFDGCKVYNYGNTRISR